MQVPAASALLTLLLVCAFALQSASALKCYDCLSVALPQCVDDNASKEFESENCGSDENVCSVLTMKDPEGTVIVSRQCSQGTSEADNLVKILEAQLKTNLKMQSFETCGGDLCNAKHTPNSATSVTGGAAIGLLVALLSLSVLRAR